MHKGCSPGKCFNTDSAFISLGKISVNRVGSCSQQGTFDDFAALALVRYVRILWLGCSA